MDEKPEEKQIQLKAEDSVLKGVYANSVNHHRLPDGTCSVTFISTDPMLPLAQVVSRVYLPSGVFDDICRKIVAKLDGKEHQQFGEVASLFPPGLRLSIDQIGQKDIPDEGQQDHDKS